MIQAPSPRNAVVLAALIAALVACSAPRPVPAQEEAVAGAFELRPGVIVDPARGLVYLMSPQGGIDAVDLALGTPVWSTEEAAKPLALGGDLLVGQVEPSGSKNELEIAALDTRQQGRRVVADAIGLPDTVRVSIDDGLDTSFAARARASATEALIAWEFLERPLRGMAPEDPRPSLRGGPPRPIESEPPGVDAPATGGTLRMNLATGALSAVEPDETVVPVYKVLDLPAADRLAGVPGPQILSADGRHVLGSERIADDKLWDKYRWTIFLRTTGERVAEFTDYRSQAPFALSGSLLIYETGPYSRRTDSGMADEPLKIRAVDLATGEERWSRPIRDTRYRGPFPP